MKKSKKLLSIVLSILMVLTMFPVMSFAEGNPVPEDTISDEMSAKHIEHETPFTFTEGEVPAGSYYLADDIALTGDLTITSEVHLCMNGKVLNINGEHKITVTGEDAALNIYDCQDTVHKFSDSEDGMSWVLDEENGDKEVAGGVITGAFLLNEQYGFLQVKNGALLNIFKGNIIGNYLYHNNTRMIRIDSARCNIYSSNLYGNYIDSNTTNSPFLICLYPSGELFLGKFVNIKYNHVGLNLDNGLIVTSWNNSILNCYGNIANNEAMGAIYVNNSMANISGTINNNTTRETIRIINNSTLNLNGVVTDNEGKTNTISVNKGSTLNIFENAVVENNTITNTEDSASTTGILLRNDGEGYTNRIVFKEVPTSGTPIEIRFQDGCENTTVELGEGVNAEDVIDKIVTYDETKYELDIIDGEIVYVPHEHAEETVPQVNATCTENGWTEYVKCSKCGLTLDNGGHEILATGHPTESYVANVNYKPATCTEDGYTGDLVCGICDEVITAGEVVPAVGHRYSELKNFVAATCTEKGYSGDVYCAICDQIVAYGHETPVVTVGDIHTDVEPKDHICDDCRAVISHCEDADKNHFCDYCGNSLSDHYDRTSDHKCDLCGYEMSVCTDTDNNHFCDLCGDRMSDCADNDNDHYCDLCNTKTSDHNYVVVDTVEATCTKGAYNVYECTICRDTFNGIEGERKAHDFAESERVNATCSEPGSVTYKCNDCDASYTVELSVKEHTPGEVSIENEQPATCTQKGSYDEVIRCADCGIILTTKSMTTPLAPHNYQATEVLAPTCTRNGYTIYTCTVCGASYKSIDVTEGHRYSEVVKIDPTCTEKGYTVMVCDECGKEFETDFKAATGHNDENKDYVCDDCGADLPGSSAKRCSWCDRYEANKDDKATGWIYKIIHFFIHLFTAK